MGKRVLVAMSGGVDSCVAAVLLHREGYEVIGATMKTWDFHKTPGIQAKHSGCCSLEDVNDAREVAVSCGFPHYILDLKETFSQGVIDNFVDEYLSGRTPNPCILCNTRIKWDALLHKANTLGCDFIATGHYARIREENGRKILMRARDKSKDQSYVLWGLRQPMLKRTLFPLGDWDKTHTRALAEKFGFGRIAGKKDSYEICFIPNNDYRRFLQRREPEKMQTLSDGLFKDPTGNVLGKHKGYPFFTIGQRKGLGVALGKPTFVIDIIPEKNEVILGDETQLCKRGAFLRDINSIKYQNLPTEIEVCAKVRYRDAGTPAHLVPTEQTTHWCLHFSQSVKGISPGQSAVFYEQDDVVGGGFIESAF